MSLEKSLPEFPGQLSDCKSVPKDFFSMIFDDLDENNKEMVVECMKSCLKCNDGEDAKKGFHDVASCMLEKCFDCSDEFKEKLESVVAGYDFSNTESNDNNDDSAKKKR